MNIDNEDKVVDVWISLHQQMGSALSDKRGLAQISKLACSPIHSIHWS